MAHSNLLEDASVEGDVVLANITAEVLVMLAPSLPGYLKKGGTLILSGIIDSRRDLVKRSFLAQGFTLLEERNKGEWYALVYKR